MLYFYPQKNQFTILWAFMAIAAYLRVSTERQGLDNQR